MTAVLRPPFAASVLLAVTLSFFPPGGAPVARAGPGDGPTPWMHRDGLLDVTFVGNEAWIVGYPGVILHSADGGATWQSQGGALDEALYAIDFIDAKRGWIVGRQGLVLQTVDGGTSWSPLESGTTEPLLAVDFVDDKHGWAVGNFRLILHTADGGKSWTRQHAKLDHSFEVPDPVLNGVFFLDPQEGWLVGEAGSVAHTTDGGATWTRQETGTTRALQGIVFFDRQRGVAVGSAGTVLRTADGGASWKADPPAEGVDEFLLDVFHGPQGTWTCGRGGVIADIGAGAPSLRATGVYVWIAAIAFGDGGAGLAVGRAGLILRTADGGQSWTVLPTRR